MDVKPNKKPMFQALAKLLGRNIRSNSTSEQVNGSEVPGGHHGKDHHHLWQKASTLRLSLRGKTPSNKSKISDLKSSRLIRSNSQHHVENKDTQKEKKPEWGSQRDLGPSFNNKECFQSKSCYNQDLELSIHCHKHSQSFSKCNKSPKVFLRNHSLSVEELKQPSLNSSETSLASQHLLDNSSENVLLQLHPIRQQRSARKLTKDSGYETSAQGEPDYVNTDWLDEAGGKHTRTSSLSSVQRYSEIQNSHQTSAPTVPSSRLSEKSVKDLTDQSESELPTNCLLTHSEALKCLRRSQSYSQGCCSERRDENDIVQNPICPSKNSQMRFDIHKRHSNTQLQLSNHNSSLESHRSHNKLQHLVQVSNSNHTSERILNCPGFLPTSSVISSLNNSFSSPNLDEDTDMVTRRFKKGSVYETLASKSGLDFAPVIQGKPYREGINSGKSWCYTSCSSGRRQSLDLGGSCLNINSTTVEKYKNSTFGAKNKRCFSQENLCHQIYGPNKQQLEKSTISFQSMGGNKGINREKSPPPPPPPVRKSSMVYHKSMLTHEKYPSWPVASVGLESSSLPVTMTTYRSHSWTDQTDYPKVRIAYSRPKKCFKISTNQLQPVPEKGAENPGTKRSTSLEPDVRIPLNCRTLESEPTMAEIDSSLRQALTKETSEKIENRSQNRPFYIPRCYGDIDYNIPSPPERDISINQERGIHKVESCWSKYNDFLKHSIGYSALSTSTYESQLSLCKKTLGQDSTKAEPCENGTPFLDRLRLEYQALNATWPPPLSSDFVETPSETGTFVENVESGSGSSQETMKWHGSYSDLSSFSVQMSNRSSLFDSGLSTMPDSGRLSPQSSCDGSISTIFLDPRTRAYTFARHDKQLENIAHSSKVQAPKRHESESVLYYTPILRQTHNRGSKNLHKSVPIDVNKQESTGISVSQRVKMFQYETEEQKPMIFSPSFPGFSQTLMEQQSVVCNGVKNSISKLTVSQEDTTHLSGNGETGVQATNNKVHEQAMEASHVSSNRSVRSVLSGSDNSGQRILYLDPGKKHRVSDPELKAIQKQAVLAFYQRQKGISESQPVGQELSCSVTVAPPVDNPKKSANQKALSLPVNNKRYIGKHLLLSRTTEANTRRCRSSEKLGSVPEDAMFEGRHGEASEFCETVSLDKNKRIDSKLVHQQSLSVPDLTDLRFSTVIPYTIEPSSSRRSLDNQWSCESLDSGPLSLPVIVNCEDSGELRMNREPGAQNKLTTSASNSIKLAIEGVLASQETQSVTGSLPNGTRYFRSYKPPRKAQVKETHHPNQTSTVKVITPDGVTLVEKVDRCATSGEDIHLPPPPEIPPRRVNKAPSPSNQRPSRPPPPRPPQEGGSATEHDIEDVELRRFHEGRTTSTNDQNQKTSVTEEGASACSSPDLPPPPATTDTEVHLTDEPFPPPPDPQEVDLCTTRQSSQTSVVYPKNSYMSYRSERKLGRQGFDGKYWRPSLNSGSYDSNFTTPQDTQSRVSPASWEKLHNIRRQGTTVIFHSNSMRGRNPSGSKSNLDKGIGAVKSNPEHKSPVVPVSTFQTADTTSPTSMCNQLVASDPISPVSSICVSVGQYFQHESSSHSPSHTEQVPSFQPLKDDQKVDTSLTSHCFSEGSANYSQLPEAEEQPNPNVNGHLYEEPSTTPNVNRTEAVKRNEASSDDRSNGVNSVQQALSDQQLGMQQNSLVNSGGGEQIPVSTMNCATQTTDTPRLGRRCKTKEEIECERLSEDFVNHCDDTMLKHLLLLAPNHKTMSDYMEGLFNLELEKGGQPVNRNRSSIRAEAAKMASISNTPMNSESRKESELPPNSAYYTTSEPKAKLLTRYSQDMDQQDWTSENELSNKKEELIASIDRKLKLLRLEQVLLREEMVQNEVLGQEVTSRVEQLAKPNEIEKYRLHVEEMEKIINLLLSLSGRLARAQNALMCLLTDVGHEEKRVLQAKCDKLSEQHEEARRLKESIDKRSHQVSLFLHRYLSSEEYADYDHFIKMKSKLLMDAREIDEKIKLGEEQLAALRHNVNFQIWKEVHTKTQGSLGT
ncbi:uncharacterized protein LOC143228781 isoform X2 [Tachypleus tridentatus]|uniref:uncharacterized protein LOC143228781 isoform X2 n=1 Tax=Tachypleus tridentatus TaxID=6853 RepID=UPI003FD63018